MTRYIIFIFLVAFGFAAQGQAYQTLKTASPKAVKQYQKARAESRSGNTTTAQSLLQKILDKQPNFIDAWLLSARLAFDRKNYEQAATQYQQVLALDRNYNPDIFYELGVTQWQLDQFETAIVQFEQYLATDLENKVRIAKAERYLENAKFAVEAVKHPVPYEPKPLPKTINSDWMEYLPSLTADEQLLIFTRRINGQEDFYYSEKTAGDWQAAKPFHALNTDKNEGAQSISSDGHTMVFDVENAANGVGGFDLLWTKTDGTKWSRPINLGATVNSKSWDAQPSVSADGRVIFFASDRAGGLGGTDIWFTVQRPDGSWIAAQNLGSPINTKYDDQAPFIHSDSRTLYFISKGHAGMGGFDLFKSELNEEGKWSTAQNLGYPINTKKDEGPMIVSLDGTTAYFTAEVGERSTDIATFQMPKAIRPKPVTYVRAIVVDATTRKRIGGATVEFENLTTNKSFTTATTDPSGLFLTVLPVGSDFALNVTAKGYLFHSEHFKLSTVQQSVTPYELKIALQPIPTEEVVVQDSEPIVLNNIFFKPNAAELLPTSFSELDRLVQLLQSQPSLRIQINGHVADVGDPKNNQSLSEARAKTVYDYLLAQGIAANRLAHKGFGASQPVADNSTEIGRQANRRTEFVVLEN